MSSSSVSSASAEQMVCHCGLQAKESMADTERNYGRRFYGCPHYGSPRKCNFFVWRDEEYSGRAIHVINKLVKEKEKLEGETSQLWDCCTSKKMETERMREELVVQKTLLERLEAEKHTNSDAMIRGLKQYDQSRVIMMVVVMFFSCVLMWQL